MNRLVIIFFLCVCTLQSFGQKKFDKGFFVDENDNRIECLIGHFDDKYNPSEFSFQVTEGSGILKRNPSNTKEFGISDGPRFVAYTGDIDRSGDKITELSTSRAPVWSRESLFLRVLVTGKANLYVYKDSNVERFFFSLDGNSPLQLINKKYMIVDINGEKKTSVNSDFRNKLWTAVKCPDTSENSVRTIEYEANTLTRYFKIYNACTGGATLDFNPELEAGGFYLNVIAGMNSRSFEKNSPPPSEKFPTKAEITAGIELEFVMAGTKGKTAILAEFMYQTYQAASLTIPNSSIDYASISIPLGVRRYFYVKDQKRLFLNVTLTTDIATNSKFQGCTYLTAGAGAKLGMFNVEFRLMQTHEILNQTVAAAFAPNDSNFSGFSLLVSYKLFGKKTGI